MYEPPYGSEHGPGHPPAHDPAAAYEPRPEPVRQAQHPRPPEQPPPARQDAVVRAFDPPTGMSWARVSHRLTWHRRVVVLVVTLPVMLIGAFLSGRGLGTVGGAVWIGLVLLGCVLGWIVAEFGYRAWGFAEGADDLLVTHGVFVRRLVVVPYGRMQYVDVTAGVLEQWLDIATVRLHTAAATTDAHIPGLRAADASMLRDRLVQKGESRTMGL